MENERRAGIINLIIPIVIIAVVSIIALLQGGNSDGADFDWREDRVVVTDPEGTVTELAYSEALSLSLEERQDFGDCLTGKESLRWVYGEWENEAWGRYRVCAARHAEKCLVFRSPRQIVVLSYESTETTELLYEWVMEHMK